MRLSELLVSIGLEAKGLRKLNQQLGEVQRNFKRSFGNIQASVQKFGSTMTSMVTAPLAGLAMGAIKASADLEKLEVSFISLTGGAEQAAAMMQNLNAFTARTPFQIENVANAARQLIASGTEVSQVNDQLQFLGDIAATSGVSIEEIAAIFAKVNAKGKVELENLNQLAERGIPIFKALSDATGLPADKLGAGAVTVEQFNQTLKGFAQQGGFAAGAMDRLSQTVQGKLSTAMDNVKLAGAEMVESLMPHIEAFLDGVTKLAQGITNMSSETKGMVLVVAGLLAATGPIALAVSALMPIIAGLMSPIGLVAAAFGGLALLIIKNFDAVEPVLIKIINGVIRFQNKTKGLSYVWRGLGAVIKTVAMVIEAAFMSTLHLVSGIIDAVNLVLDMDFSGAADRMGEAFGDIAETAMATGADIGQAWSDAMAEAASDPDLQELEPGAISSYVDKVVTQLNTAFSGGAPVQVPVTPTTGGGGEAAAPDTGPVTFGAQFLITDDMVSAADERVNKLMNTMSMLRDHMQQVGASFQNAFTSAFDVILSGGDNMGEQLKEIGRQLLQNLIKIAIGNAIAAAFSPLSPDNAATGGLAGIAKSAFLQGLIPSLMPKLAKGGLAFGPTMAVVGDNPGARVDPEVIAPLSKLQAIMGQGQHLSGRVSGRDILLTSARDRDRSRRTYGSFAF